MTINGLVMQSVIMKVGFGVLEFFNIHILVLATQNFIVLQFTIHRKRTSKHVEYKHH